MNGLEMADHLWWSGNDKTTGPEMRSVIARKNEGVEMEEFGGWQKYSTVWMCCLLHDCISFSKFMKLYVGLKMVNFTAYKLDLNKPDLKQN